MTKNAQDLVEYLSPHEKKIVPLLNADSIKAIVEKSGLDRVAVLRALEYLQNKDVVQISVQSRTWIEKGVNGILYAKKGLPERRLLNLLAQKHMLTLDEAQKEGKFSPEEFKAALGALKKKAQVTIVNGKLSLTAKREEIAKKTLEEQLLEVLPMPKDDLAPEQQFALQSLTKRKNIISIEERKATTFTLTPLGRALMKADLKGEDAIETITQEMIKKGNWKGKKFRRYDVTASVPKLYGGKRHFVNQAIEYARKVWTELGFEEMKGDYIQSSFWNFDALFTAQDHPVREMQDTFFLEVNHEGLANSRFPSAKTVEAVKEAHESGIEGSSGWQYTWKEKEAQTMVLRTHTTCLSAHTLYNIGKKLRKENKPYKYFAIGKCFRNETVDWSHGFEFNQTEGIVIDENANFAHLLGYLKEFFKKMGYENLRFRPGYFPYTEPSVEIDFFHPEKKVWLELGGAGIFRPEVVVPLLGKNVPVLAWGPGFDRILMDYYAIKDLRQLYENNIPQLRNTKHWMKG